MAEQTGIKKVASAGIGYVIGGILIKGIAFITTPIFSRLLTPEEFGILNTYLSYESILAMLIGFQFAGCLKNAKIKYADEPAGLDKFFTSLITLLLIHSAIALVLVNVFAAPVMELTGLSSILMLNLLVINCFGNSAMTVYNSYLSLNYEYKKYVAISIFNAIANIALSLLLIFTILDGNRSTARILGYVIPYMVVSVYLVFVAFRKDRPSLKKTKEYSAFAYRFCAPLIPNGFAEVMLTQYSKLAVDKSCGVATMGVYSLACNVYSIVATVKLGMDYVIGPFYFDKRTSGDFAELRKIFKIYSRCLALISVIIMLFSPEIVRILGDEAYYDARISAIPLIAVSYFSFTCYMLSQEEYFVQKTYYVSAISVVTMIINIVLCTVFVPKYEAVGAAYCALISFVVMFLLHFIVIKFILKSESFRWRNLFVDGAFVALMSIVAVLVVDSVLYRVGIIAVVVILSAVFLYRNFKHIIRFKNKKSV